jgi:hypothetical protein
MGSSATVIHNARIVFSLVFPLTSSVLSSGMRLAPLTNVADESRTMLAIGLAKARTNGWSVIAALPSTFYPQVRFFGNACPGTGLGG